MLKLVCSLGLLIISIDCFGYHLYSYDGKDNSISISSENLDVSNIFLEIANNEKSDKADFKTIPVINGSKDTDFSRFYLTTKKNGENFCLTANNDSKISEIFPNDISYQQVVILKKCRFDKNDKNQQWNFLKNVDTDGFKLSPVDSSRCLVAEFNSTIYLAQCDESNPRMLFSIDGADPEDTPLDAIEFETIMDYKFNYGCKNIGTQLAPKNGWESASQRCYMNQNEYITSENGKYGLLYQSDLNLVVYKALSSVPFMQALWDTGAISKDRLERDDWRKEGKIFMQGNGNFLFENCQTKEKKYSSKTDSKNWEGSKLILNNDGELLIKSPKGEEKNLSKGKPNKNILEDQDSLKSAKKEYEKISYEYNSDYGHRLNRGTKFLKEAEDAIKKAEKRNKGARNVIENDPQDVATKWCNSRLPAGDIRNNAINANWQLRLGPKLVKEGNSKLEEMNAAKKKLEDLQKTLKY